MALTPGERCLALLLHYLARAFLALLSLAVGASSSCRAVAAALSGSPAPRRAPRTVPPPDQPLLLLSGVELARRIRRREVKCVEVTEVYIERIKQVNPLINAVVKDRFEAALQEAQEVDRLLAEGREEEESLREKFPFLGVPVTIKDSFSLHGLPNTSGLLSRRNVVPVSDAVVVSRLKQAGAIPLGVTNVSELCMWYESSNLLYGRSNNPYNLGCTVGGSSGGEGSILAAAGSVIGIGADIGGSIRMPSFFNGIFGHKPTTGVVPNDGQFPNVTDVRSSFLCTGPMCRYADDLEPMLRVMAGPNISKLKLDEKVSLKDIKFYSMEHDGGSVFVFPVEKEILQAHRKMVKQLEADLGVTVENVSIHKMKYSFPIWTVMMSPESGEGQEGLTFTDLLGDHGKPVWPLWELVKWMLRIPSHTLPAIGLGLTEKFSKYSRRGKLASMAQTLKTEMVDLLGDNGVLLYPSHPVLAPRHHAALGMPFNFAYTAIFNILGLPVTQCPLGLSKDGLPLGIQVVAGHLNDHLTLIVAQYLEKMFGGWVPPGMS